LIGNENRSNDNDNDNDYLRFVSFDEIKCKFYRTAQLCNYQMNIQIRTANRVENMKIKIIIK